MDNSNILLEIDGIKGSSTLADYKNQIECHSWSFNVTQPTSNTKSGTERTAANPIFSDINISKETDISSTDLLRLCATAKEVPNEKCFAVATSFADYPTWAKDVKQADIKDRDAQGRALIVDYRASALGRSTHFTLKYDYANAPRRLSWSMVDGDIMREIHGAYTFEAQGDQTKISYDLSIELIIPLPGFVKRRAEVRILSTLKELKARIES